MRRRVAVVGDRLSSGGSVLPGSSSLPVTMNGHQVARIGGPAFCEACKTTGVIAKAGGPYRLSMAGECVLDQDIVFCGCSKPPKVVAQLAGESWCDDMIEGHGEVVSGLTATGGVASVKKGAFDESVKAIVDGPEGYPYYIETSDGRVHSGQLDASGILPRIHTGDSPDDYVVYWGDEAIAKKHGE